VTNSSDFILGSLSQGRQAAHAVDAFLLGYSDLGPEIKLF